MPRELYSNDINGLLPHKLNDEHFTIGYTSVNSRITNWKNVLYWNITALGKAKICVVYDGDQLVHTSYVISSKEKFSFLKSGDIEIGPCWTNPDYRGQGIYPAVITYVMQQELSGGGTAYMIVNSSNSASQHGIMKVGFKKTGDTVVKNAFARHIIKKQ